jgi:hypothetical protein
MKPKAKDLWKCPECGRRFANQNQSHSCGRYTVEEFLEGRPARAVALFKVFADAAGECGPVTLAPAKTRVGFQARMIFAAVNRLGALGLEAHVVLARRLDGPRFTRVESLSARNHVHHFIIRSPEEVDEEVGSWLREAYRVGAQEHLAKD